MKPEYQISERQLSLIRVALKERLFKIQDWIASFEAFRKWVEEDDLKCNDGTIERNFEEHQKLLKEKEDVEILLEWLKEKD